MGNFALTVNQDTSQRLTLDNGGSIDADPIPNATLRQTEGVVISVPVPVLAAAALGYVDVSTVGTALEGITAGSPVGYNPTADVQAAGAGNGGPREVRCSAPNTIRIAFVGTTTAHAVDFTFWRA